MPAPTCRKGSHRDPRTGRQATPPLSPRLARRNFNRPDSDFLLNRVEGTARAAVYVGSTSPEPISWRTDMTAPDSHSMQRAGRGAMASVLLCMSLAAAAAVSIAATSQTSFLAENDAAMERMMNGM